MHTRKHAPCMALHCIAATKSAALADSELAVWVCIGCVHGALQLCGCCAVVARVLLRSLHTRVDCSAHTHSTLHIRPVLTDAHSLSLLLVGPFTHTRALTQCIARVWHGQVVLPCGQGCEQVGGWHLPHLGDHVWHQLHRHSGIHVPAWHRHAGLHRGLRPRSSLHHLHGHSVFRTTGAAFHHIVRGLYPACLMRILYLTRACGNRLWVGVNIDCVCAHCFARNSVLEARFSRKIQSAVRHTS